MLLIQGFSSTLFLCRTQVTYFNGLPLETEITKYLDRLALKVNFPIYKKTLKREVNTDFYFLIDSELSAEEIQFAASYFKEEMRKFITKEPSKIDALVNHPLISHTVIIRWDKTRSELIYSGPIPKKVLEKRGIQI